MDDATDVLASAFEQLDLDVVASDASDDPVADVVLDPHGIHLPIEVKRLALVTAQSAATLVKRPRQELRGDEVARIVVADRVTAEARAVLTAGGWGYLDLRGHLWLRVPGRIAIIADVEPAWAQADRPEALAGKAGLEVAAALLMRPDRRVGVRELAREVGRSPSTVSTITSALRRDQLVDDDLRADGPRLFWELVRRWPGERTYLAEMPQPANVVGVTSPLTLGLDDVEASEGWAMTDSAAAAALGAPIAVSENTPFDFFVPDATVARRALRLLGRAMSQEVAACSVRIAPVPAACRQRLKPPGGAWRWPVAHPLFVALDLAQDEGRGREILDGWSPQHGWRRVW